MLAPHDLRSRVKSHGLLFLVVSVLLVLFGLAAAVLLGIESTVPGDASARVTAFLLSPPMIATVMLTTVLIGVGFWMLARRAPKGRDPDDVPALLARQKRRLAFVYGLFLLCSVGIAARYVHDLRGEAEEHGATLVTEIATLKAQQVDKWALDRTLNAQYLASSLEAFAGLTQNGDPMARSIIEVMLAKALANYPNRVAILLLDPDNKPIASAGPAAQVAELPNKLDAWGLIRKQTTVTELDASAAGGANYQYVVVPVGGHGAGGKPMAALVIVVDAMRDFLPQLRAWPGTTRSGVVIVVRRVGNVAMHVVMPEARVNQHAPERIDLSDRGLPSVAALLEGDGFRIGNDAFGHAVLSASRHPRELDWVIVAKIDRDEVLSSVAARTYTLAAVVALVNVIAALLLLVVARSQRADVLRVQSDWERERRVSDAHHQQMFATMQEIAFLMDGDGRILDANAAAQRAYGYTLEEFRKRTALDMRAPSERGKFLEQWPTVEQGASGVVFETIHQRKDGTLFPVEILNHTYVDTDGTTYWRGFIRDLTARKQLEQRILRLSRVKKVMFDATEAVLRADSEAGLLPEICETLSRMEGYRLAAIHRAEHDSEKSVRLLAVAGPAKPYLENLTMSWSDETLLGLGPTGSALRTGEVQVNQDFAKNNAVAPWRESAERHGLHASIALPLATEGEDRLSLTLYASEPDAFDFEEVALLRHLADDVAFGVSTLRRKAAMEILTRRQRGIFEALRATLSATSERELFQEVCSIIVDVAGYTLAGVGMVEMDEAQSVRFVAGAGLRAANVADVHVSWGENAYGSGPVGRAVRSRLVQVARNRAGDPTLAAWRPLMESIKLEVQATVALPLITEGEVFAVLAVYSSDPDPFDADELAMLGAFANDLSLGVQALRLRASHK